MAKRDKEPERSVSRRRFCQMTGISACTLAMGGASALSIGFLRPRALFEPPTRFQLVPPAAVGVGTVLAEEDKRIYVVRLQDGFRALSSVCTHLGCITRYQPDQNAIACPCHGSQFDLNGEVLAGPAPRPLDRFQMTISERGRIVVDTSINVPLGTVFKL